MARILLAEDDSSMRQFLAMALKKAGHEVLTANDGMSAFEIIKDDGARERNFDLLLTDIVMPGMDGIELSKKAAKLFPSIKVMFITGFAAVAMEHNDKNNNTKLLSKPFHLKDLVNQVDNLLAV